MTATLSHTDTAAIRALTDQYSDAVTRREFATIKRLGAEGGLWVFTSPYDQTVEGRDAILTLLRGLLGSMEFFVQLPHEGVVEIEGDQARARWTMLEIGRTAAGCPDM